jgi:hypothetical protein
MPQEQLHQVPGRALGRLSGARGVPEEVIHEQGDVRGAVPQGGHGQGQHVETEEEVLAEPAQGDALLEVPVGGGQDAGGAVTLVVLSDAAVPSFLQEAQQLGLQTHGEFSDLVEEEGAASGLLHRADAITHGAGEGAAHVAEELGLQQVLGQGCAVHGDEGSRAARAQGVQRPGDQLLAGTTLALDQHGLLVGGEQAQLAEHPPHGVAATHDPQKALGFMIVHPEGPAILEDHQHAHGLSGVVVQKRHRAPGHRAQAPLAAADVVFGDGLVTVGETATSGAGLGAAGARPQDLAAGSAEDLGRLPPRELPRPRREEGDAKVQVQGDHRLADARQDGPENRGLAGEIPAGGGASAHGSAPGWCINRSSV